MNNNLPPRGQLQLNNEPKTIKNEQINQEIDQLVILFMQNKANFKNAQMNVSFVYTKDYEDFYLFRCGKNEPKRTQNEPNLQNAKNER